MCCTLALVSGPTSNRPASDGTWSMYWADVDDGISCLFWLATLAHAAMFVSHHFLIDCNVEYMVYKIIHIKVISVRHFDLLTSRLVTFIT